MDLNRKLQYFESALEIFDWNQMCDTLLKETSYQEKF